jgi:hypothetical protein
VLEAAYVLTFGIVAVIAGRFSRFMTVRGKRADYMAPISPESEVVLARATFMLGLLLVTGSSTFLIVDGLTHQFVAAVVLSSSVAAVLVGIGVSRTSVNRVRDKSS